MKPEHNNVPVLPAEPARGQRLPGVASVLARVGDKWSVFVIMMLDGGPLRFNELKRMVGGISQRMLTLTLRGWSATAWSRAPYFRPFRRASTTN